MLRVSEGSRLRSAGDGSPATSPESVDTETPRTTPVSPAGDFSFGDLSRVFAVMKLSPAFEDEELWLLSLTWRGLVNGKDQDLDGPLASFGAVSAARVPAALEPSVRSEFERFGKGSDRRSPSWATPAIEGLQFDPIASTDDAEGARRVFDLADQLGRDPSIEHGDTIFQLNTKKGIFLLRASGPKERRQLVNLLRLVLGIGRLEPTTGARRNETAALEKLMAKVETNFQQSKEVLSKMESDVDARTESLTKLVDELKRYEAQKVQLAVQLRQSERSNEELVAKLEDVEYRSSELTQRLEIIQSNVFSKLENMMAARSVDKLNERLRLARTSTQNLSSSLLRYVIGAVMAVMLGIAAFFFISPYPKIWTSTNLVHSHNTSTTS
ncbi:hypothetical protein DFJ74DRAFT_681814 [Hyaloraphidium curvatum]|nr:hypothetical protein DFJ74DRAFT_681814 [Hyaloraphidium curvatum]